VVVTYTVKCCMSSRTCSWMERGGPPFEAHLAAEARRARAALAPLEPLQQALLEEMLASLPTKQVRLSRRWIGSVQRAACRPESNATPYRVVFGRDCREDVRPYSHRIPAQGTCTYMNTAAVIEKLTKKRLKQPAVHARS